MTYHLPRIPEYEVGELSWQESPNDDDIHVLTNESRVSVLAMWSLCEPVYFKESTFVPN